MIHIEFITIIVKLTNDRYIFSYYILNNDDDCTFNLYVSFISFIIICLTVFESVICCNLYHNIFEALKEWHKVSFSISIFISIGKFMIPVSFKQRTQNRRAIAGVSLLWWAISQYIFKWVCALLDRGYRCIQTAL